MVTKEIVYATSANGYNAMISDFKEIFDWDEIEPNEGSATFTNFKKSCGSNAYIGLRITQNATNCPTISAIINNGIDSFVTASSCNCKHAAYDYGDGIFASCVSSSALPNTGQMSFFGVSTCRNIITGETSWCVFINSTIVSNTALNYNYSLLTKDTKSLSNTNWSLTTDAKIGSATLLHEPKTGFVADKIMILTAIPDNYYACIAPVVFNGVRYTRLGTLLIPVT